MRGSAHCANVLKPDGAMHLMVYAPYGRTGIYMLQEFCRRIGIHATDGDIRDLIAALGALPPGHPLENLLREAPDFRHEAALADALLHPQDRAYSVPQLFEFIERGGLAFGRWVKQAPYSRALWCHGAHPAGVPDCANFPGRAVRRRRTVSRHDGVATAWLLYRNDRPGGRSLIGFAGDAWLGYVPIRMSDTICVQERLPPGAAGVLINQTHTYRDLIMPIDATEKRLFDAIDGRTVALARL